MPPLRGLIGAIVVMAYCGSPAAGSLTQAGDPGEPFVRFQQAVDAYMALHEGVERSLPPLQVTPDMERIGAITTAMADAMRTARSSAVEGEIFNSEVAAIIRGMLRDLTSRDERGTDVLSFTEDDEEGPTLWRPLIHDEFDWTGATQMSPWVLMALPPLPQELQFRFVGCDLVIVDLHSSLIVDVLPDALPACGSLRGGLARALSPAGSPQHAGEFRQGTRP